MRKRILSALLALTLLAPLIPATIPRAAALTVDETYNTGAGKGGGGGALDSSIFKNAIVRNTPASGKPFGTAGSLEVTVKTKAFGSQNSIFAVVMRASDYKQGPQSSMGISEATYAKLTVNDDYYAIGRQNPASAEENAEIALPLVVASEDNASKLAAGTSIGNKQMRTAIVSTSDTSSYYDEYVLIVFAAEKATDDNFYVDRFYVDADGYVRTPSYLVRYNGKGADTNTVPAREIIRAKTYDELTDYSVKGETPNIAANPPAGTPKRVGYTFLGWDTNSAATTPTYTKGSTLTKPANSTGELYHIIDLYAVWKAIPVAFDADMDSVDTKTLPDPQVGVNYEQKGELHVVDTGEPDAYRTDKRSGKTFSVTKAEWKTSAEAEAAWTEIPKENGGLLDGQKMPDGLKLESDGTAGWKITGKPITKYAYPIRLTVQVKDNGNASTDTLMIVFNQIQKGNIAAPARDVNTGLQTNVLASTGSEGTPEEGGGTTAAVSDGVIFGFYSKGQDAENGYTEAEGSGSLYDYYTSITNGDWTEALVYEYIPYLKPDGTPYGLAESDNANWREVPMPESFYKHVAEADKTLLGDSMKSAATEKAHSSYTASDMAVTKDTPAASPEGTAWAGWDATYGEIRFEKVDAFGALSPSEGNGFPVVHGLVEGATYKVRFKQNSDFGQSDPVELVIAAGGGSGSGGGGAADPSDCVSVVFYDWDETTVLGSTVVVKGQDATAQINLFTQSLIAPDSKDKTGNDSALDFFIDDESYPLSYKRGYSFYGWLPYSGSYNFTHCGKALSGDNLPITIAPPTTDELQDFSSPQQSIIVKACYADNEELYYDLSSFPNMQYTLEQSYNRVGTTPTYSITVVAKRERLIDGEIRGVPRMINPQLRAMLQTNISLYNFYVLSNSDVTATTVYPSTSVSRVTCSLVDFYQAASKTGAAVKSNTQNTPYEDASNPENGFKIAGNIGLINEQLAAHESTYLTAIVLRNGAGLTLSAGGYSVDAVSLRQAWIKKNSIDGDGIILKPEQLWVGLTRSEMQYAIDSGGGWLAI